MLNTKLAINVPPHQAIRLKAWVEANEPYGHGREWLAEQCAVTVNSIGRYMREPGDSNFRVPIPEVMGRLYLATGGQIGPASFYILPELGRARASRKAAA